MTEYFRNLGIFGWIEILAMIVGFIYVVLQIQKSRKMWYACIVSALLNILVYSNSHYISMMLIQFYYIIASVYGLVQWSKVRKEAIGKYGVDNRTVGHKIAIVRFNKKVGLVSTAVALAVFFILAPLLSHFLEMSGQLAFPGQAWCDAAVAVASMLATFWLSKSYIEQWYMWIVINAVSIPIFIMGHIYWIALLYVAYLVMAVVGLRQWKRLGVIVE